MTEMLAELLALRGIAHFEEAISLATFYEIAQRLGVLAGSEIIGLRAGAPAYVAKPGRVPLHTDHADVDVVAWWCELQDDIDGSTHLLDARPVIDALSPSDRAALRKIELYCPMLAGGPPVLRFPVLRESAQGAQLFCSPWLRCVRERAAQQETLDRFRAELSAAARTSVVSNRLRSGQALFVDNHRVLHGRDPLAHDSLRRIHRLWIQQQR